MLSDYWIKGFMVFFSNKTSALYELFVRTGTWMMVLNEISQPSVKSQ